MDSVGLPTVPSNCRLFPKHQRFRRWWPIEIFPHKLKMIESQISRSASVRMSALTGGSIPQGRLRAGCPVVLNSAGVMSVPLRFISSYLTFWRTKPLTELAAHISNVRNKSKSGFQSIQQHHSEQRGSEYFPLDPFQFHIRSQCACSGRTTSRSKFKRI